MLKNILLILFITLLCIDTGKAVPFELTESEQIWLEAHPEIIVGVDNDYPPQSMVNKEGKAEGIDPEVVKLLNKRLSGRLKIRIEKWQKNYKDLIEKRIDALMSVTPSKERETYFNFTHPYISDPHVIVARKDNQQFINLPALHGYTVAQEKDTFLASYIEKNHPAIKIRYYSNTLAALKGVQQKEVHAHIGSKPETEYLLSKFHIQDLDFHGQSTETSETNVIAVRKDWPELASILKKALDSVPYNQINAAKEKWSKSDQVKTKAQDIKLTEEERIWIQNHPNIIVGAETDYPPYDYVANGKAVGFSNDYIRLLAEKAGLNIKFIHGYSWAQLLDKTKRKEIDILPGLVKNIDREKYIDFTKPYYSAVTSIFVHSRAKEINSVGDLAGKSVALISGYAYKKELIKKYSGINFVTFKSPLEALIAVSEGRIDGYQDYLGTINYIRREHMIPNLRVATTNTTQSSNNTHIGVRKDWPILTRILEKAMAHVTSEEYDTLKKRWIVAEPIALKKFQLTPAEKEWLDKLGTLRIGIDLSWVPIKFTSIDGTHKGVSSEYTRIIRKKLGLNLKTISAPWTEILKKAQAGDIDILPFLNETEERRKYLTFTKPVINIPMIIATRNTTPYISNVKELVKLKVGAGKGFAIIEKMRKKHPEIRPIEYPTIEKAIRALDSGEITALIANSAVFSYHLRQLNLQSTIHINNTAPYEDSLAFGVKHELSPLVPLINRVLTGISHEEHDLIMDKWVNVSIKKKTDWVIVWQVIGIGLAILTFILFWSARMALEIKKRREAEARLVKSDERFETVFSKISEIVLVWDKNYRYIYANQSALDYVNANKEDIYGKKLSTIFSHNQAFADLWQGRIEETFKSGKTSHYEDHLTLNEQDVFSESVMEPLFADSGKIYAVSLVYKDVSEREKTKAELKKYADTQAALLKEVNHRVKNNLSAIISMLHMEEEKTGSFNNSQSVDTPFRNIEKRILSLLVVHSMLSESKWQPLRLTDICEKVIRSNIKGVADDREFELNIKTCDILLDSDHTHSIALILSELAVNSLKYAYVNGNKLIISVSAVIVKNSIELTYSDNGPGFPDTMFDNAPSSKGYGIEIIMGITSSNLAGQIELFNKKGACIRINLPVKHTKNRIINEI